MVIHYSATPETVACGRTGSSLNTTADANQATCKLCLRTMEKQTQAPVSKTPSLAELRAAAKAAKPAAVVVEAPIVTVAAASARTEWARRLEQLPGRNRLPRGQARQTFI